MTDNFFIKGAIIGLSVAAPVGPIGVLCIKRTLSEGRLSGLLTGLGAAAADALYGTIAGFGFTAISNFLVAQQFWMRSIGGVFLLYLGIKLFFSSPASEAAAIKSNGLFQNFISTFFLTITNPATIISFMAIFAGFGLGTQSGYFSSLTLVVGVLTGSALWWLTLSSVTGLLQTRINAARLVWLNRISGLIIVSFGAMALYSLI